MPELDAAALDAAFAVAARQVDEGTAPWAVLGVATRERLLRLEAVSPAGPDPRVGTGTVALVASISKPIFATVVMQLVAEGRLSLRQPVEEILPEAARSRPAGAPPITPWHLLSHTSGLVDLDVTGPLSRCETHEEAVRLLLQEPRRWAPGERYAYATATFDLLGALVEKLDGRPYPEALRARVLDPLGMDDTTFDPRVGHADRFTIPLTSPAPGAGPFDDATMGAFIRFAMPGAGLWSTASDILRFGRAFLRGGELDGVRILAPAHVALMTREVTVNGLGRAADPLEDAHYALGWGTRGPTSPGAPGAFGHGGITGTRLWVDPANDLAIVYLTGVWDQPPWAVDPVMNAVYAALR